MKIYKIGVINFGSTSTKVAYYENDKQKFIKNIKHTAEELNEFNTIFDQLDFRYEKIVNCFNECGVNLASMDCIASRSGNIAPQPGGVYIINDEMVKQCTSEKYGSHPSNLGPAIAMRIAQFGPIPVTVDPPTTDEFENLARYSGISEIQRISSFQALNQRAVAKKYSQKSGIKYEKLNLIVVHMGGGISVVAHKKGKMVDGNNALDGDGPFSTNRAGGLPTGSLIDLCFSGKYSYQEMQKKINGQGGLMDYLGENDVQTIEMNATENNNYNEVLKAMCYQVSKEIGSEAAVLEGKVDAILITGGMANSKLLTGWITDRVSFIAPVHLFPGEFEMETLANNALNVLKGEIQPAEITGGKHA